MISLALNDGLDLPESAVTSSLAFLAMKGAGKSNAAVVFAEALFDLSIPWVCVDPKGDWWGIRSGAGGKRGGLAVPIFGGLHADVPLDPGAGALFADLIVDNHLTCLIDVSELTKGESVRFLTAFFDRLYRRKNKHSYPMHLFLEECDEYIPQKVYREVATLVRTVEMIVKRGRARGLGITLASQRAASVNKDVLTQTDCLVALRNTSPQDRKAIEAWLSWHATSQEVAHELPTLQNGQAWVSWPQRGILDRVKFRRRRTFDSGATPELGEKVKAATLADIDVAAITASVGELVEKAKADDPKVLRARIAALERKTAAPAQPAEVVREVEVPFVPPEVTVALQRLLEEYDRTLAGMGRQREVIEAALKVVRKDKTERAPRRAPAARATAQPATSAGSTDVTPTSARHPDGSADVRLGNNARGRILAALAQFPDGLTQNRAAAIAGESPRKSTVRLAVEALRRAGLVGGSADMLRITPLGLERCPTPTLPTGPALVDHWRAQLGNGAARRIFDVIADAHPVVLSREEIGVKADVDPGVSTFRLAVEKLRRLGIVSGYELDDDFAAAIA